MPLSTLIYLGRTFFEKSPVRSGFSLQHARPEINQGIRPAHFDRVMLPGSSTERRLFRRKTNERRRRNLHGHGLLKYVPGNFAVMVFPLESGVSVFPAARVRTYQFPLKFLGDVAGPLALL